MDFTLADENELTYILCILYSLRNMPHPGLCFTIQLPSINIFFLLTDNVGVKTWDYV